MLVISVKVLYRWQAIYAVNGTIQTSDGREKNTIVDSNLGLDFVTSLRPVSYKWNVGENVVTYDEEKNPIVTPRVGVRTHYGFIAQEVQAVIPSGVDFGGFVQEPNDGMMSLRYHEFIGPLVKAIQEQQVTITALTARITALEGA
jgi:trimeric autotransporter adhesin